MDCVLAIRAPAPCRKWNPGVLLGFESFSGLQGFAVESLGLRASRVGTRLLGETQEGIAED